MRIPTRPANAQPGDFVGVHLDATGGADHRHTYLIAGPAGPDGTLPIWHADLTQPAALDWAATIHPYDIRYLIRTTPTGVATWRCHCCHPDPGTADPEATS